MQEALRQQMLQAMGQTVLLPRFVLPNAKPSALLAQAAEAEKPTVNAETAVENVTVAAVEATENIENTESNAANKQSAKALKALLGDAVANIAIDAAAETAKQAKTAVAPFRHRLVIFSGMMFLLDQPSLEWQDEKTQLQFFHNIFQAVTNKRSELMLQDKFQWPPGKGLPLADSEAKAIEQAFITAQAEKYQARWLIICGEKVAEQLLDSKLEAGEAGFISSLNCLVMHEPQHYFQQPLHKRILWQSLQVVCQSFSNT
jgi:hypothetical protein